MSSPTPLRESAGTLRRSLARAVQRITASPLGAYQSAVVRIGVSLTSLLFLLREWPHRHELYGPDGPWSWGMARRLISNNDAFTALMWSDSTIWFETVYALTLVSAALLTVGWRTRATSVLFMAGVLSLQNRSIFMGDGGDNVIHLMALYLVLTRCARVWSLDARRKARRLLTPPETAARPATSRGSSCGRYSAVSSCLPRSWGTRWHLVAADPPVAPVAGQRRLVGARPVRTGP